MTWRLSVESDRSYVGGEINWFRCTISKLLISISLPTISSLRRAGLALPALRPKNRQEKSSSMNKKRGLNPYIGFETSRIIDRYLIQVTKKHELGFSVRQLRFQLLGLFPLSPNISILECASTMHRMTLKYGIEQSFNNDGEYKRHHRYLKHNSWDNEEGCRYHTDNRND